MGHPVNIVAEERRYGQLAVFGIHQGGQLAIASHDLEAHALRHIEEIRMFVSELPMRAVLLDRLPNVATAVKTNADRPLNGVKVNDAALVRALLDHGSYDAYFYIRESASNQKAEAYRNGDRLQALDLGSLESFRFQSPDDLVLFTSSHHLAKYVPFRQFCGHMEWPICGLTHGLSTNSLIPSYSWNYFAAVKSYDAIICTSDAGKRALANIFEGLATSRSVAGVRGCFPPRMPLIPLGIDSENISTTWHAGPKNSEQSFVVLSIGRLTASYKADLRPMIAAFLRCDRLPSDSILILAGDDTQGHATRELEDYSSHFVSPRKVVVMPNISDMTKAALLKSADVALCMSDTYQETFGLSVLEAMRAGLPVVAPSWSGYREIIEDCVTGFLVRTAICPDNGFLSAVSMLIDPAHVFGQRVVIDLDQMMDRLRILSDDRSLSARMGAKGRDRVEALFSWRSVVYRYEELWNDQLQKGKFYRRTSTKKSFGFMDYDSIFAGHPDNTVPLETAVRLQKDDAMLALLDAGQLFSPPPIAGFSDDLDQRILDAVRAEPAIALEQLIEIVADPCGGRSMVISQISRLAKYGLLSFSFNEQMHTEDSSHEIDTSSILRSLSV